MKPEDQGHDRPRDTDAPGDGEPPPEAYLRAMSSPPPSERAAAAIATAMEEYDRRSGRDSDTADTSATVTSILLGRWRQLSAAAAAVMILAAGSIVVLSDRGGPDRGTDLVAEDASVLAPAQNPAASRAAPDGADDTAENTEISEFAGSGDSGGPDVADGLDITDRMAAPAEIDDGHRDAAPESDTDPAGGPVARGIAAPDDPDAPVLETPADLVDYARDHADLAGTIPGPPCIPETSTMLGHARYRSTSVAVVRMIDDSIAAITLDDCAIVMTTE